MERQPRDLNFKSCRMLYLERWLELMFSVSYEIVTDINISNRNGLIEYTVDASPNALCVCTLNKLESSPKERDTRRVRVAFASLFS